MYLATEYIEGCTLAQWMTDNPDPDIETVRQIVEQIAHGLRAFHKLEMVHQDLRPENVMIDRSGTVKIIDFGSVRVAGVAELSARDEAGPILGAVQYAAPEYFLGEGGSARSDLFSLGVITYQMLTGRLPYSAEVPKLRTRRDQMRLTYESLLGRDRAVPAWVDYTLRKAVHPNPAKRYAELSEFTYDLRHPSRVFLSRTERPLLERDPAGFWRTVSMILAVFVAFLLYRLLGRG